MFLEISCIAETPFCSGSVTLQIQYTTFAVYQRYISSPTNPFLIAFWRKGLLSVTEITAEQLR